MTGEKLKCPTKDPGLVGQNVQRATKSFREACKGDAYWSHSVTILCQLWLRPVSLYLGCFGQAIDFFFILIINHDKGVAITGRQHFKALPESMCWNVWSTLASWNQWANLITDTSIVMWSGLIHSIRKECYAVFVPYRMREGNIEFDIPCPSAVSLQYICSVSAVSTACALDRPAVHKGYYLKSMPKQYP